MPPKQASGSAGPSAGASGGGADRATPYISSAGLPGILPAGGTDVQANPNRLARRVQRAQQQGGGAGDEQEPGADAAAFVAFEKMSDELDELFVGKDK